MKSYIILIISAFVVLTGGVSYVSSAEESASGKIETNQASNTGETTGIEDNLLLVEDIIPVDDRHVIVVFNQDIIRESVRVRIGEQDDESNILIDSFTGGENNYSIEVILKDALTADTSYRMTIISAISEEGIIIKDGADGIKEFNTPEDLAVFEPVVLNAPTNPNAVMVAASTGSSTQATGSTMLPTPSNEEQSPAETAGELPLTGVNSTIFLIIAAVLALALVLRRRQA